MVGKGGVSETLVAEAEKLLDIHELVKGRVLETAMMTRARSATHFAKRRVQRAFRSWARSS